MNKFIYTLLLLILSSLTVHAQTVDWGRHITTTETTRNAQIKDVATDASGNVYAIGQFEGGIDLDGDNIIDITNPSTTLDAILLVKYNSTGALVWAMMMPGSSTCYGEGITVDPSGNIYITGAFRGTIDFDPIGGTVPPLASSASDDIFVAKYNPDGICQWVFPIGQGSTSNDGFGIATDGTDLYVVGRFVGTNVDFDPSAGVNQVSSVGTTSSGYDMFLAKYDVDANHQWVVTAGEISGDEARDVAIDSNGDVYVVGRFDDNGVAGGIDFNPLGGPFMLTSENSSSDAFIAKYNSGGDCQWAHSFGAPASTNAELGYGLALDPSNNVYITGQTEGDTDFDPSAGTALFNNTPNTNEDIFLASYTDAGAFRWLAKVGSTADNLEYGTEISATSNYVYLTGRVRGTTVDVYDATSNSVPQNTIATGAPSGVYSAFFGKFTTNGEYLNSFVASGTDEQEGLAIHAANNKVYWVGTLESANVDFDPSAGTLIMSKGATTRDDGFIIQYDDTPPSTVEEIAITEWLTNPNGAENTIGNRVEYVELYNFGATTINLRDWRIKDEDSDDDLISATDLFLNAGEYLIIAKNKAEFELNWLNGCPNPKVIEVAGLTLANGTDEIVIEADNGDVIWTVAYANDDDETIATHYTEATYTTRIWGSKAVPGINRSGNDPATNTLGYEKNNATADPDARTANNGDHGSPLQNYQSTDIARGTNILFDGISGNAQLPFIIDPAATNFTAELWFKAQNVATNPIFLHQQNGSGTGRQILRIGGTSNLRSQIGNVNTTGSTTLVDNEWYHAAVTWDGTTLNLYLNGRLEASNNLTPEASDGTMILAANRAVGNRFVDGNIDELRFWNIARSEEEIRENMHLTLQGCETGLLAYYQFNENTGITLNDKTNNGYTATLAGTTTWEASGVNTGQDALRNSNSQTIMNVPTGSSDQVFAAANLQINFKEHSALEDITVSYQNFAPNTTTGISNAYMPTDRQWTITDSDASVTTRLMDLIFTFPAGTFTNLDPKKYVLYWRAHNSEDNWLKLNPASLISSNTITFRGIDRIGQFMVQQRSQGIVSDVRGNMYTLDGVDEAIVAGNLGAVNNWTIETWFKPNGLNNYENIFHSDFPTIGTSNNGVRLELSNNFISGHLYVSVSGDNSFIPHTIVPLGGSLPNEWHHIAIVGDQTNNRIYVYLNGILRVDVAHANWPTDFPNMVIGKGFDLTPADREFSGSLDEFRVWNEARSQDQIRENIHLTLKGDEANLTAYYQFNNDIWTGTDYTIVDASPNANNGTTLNVEEADYLPSEVAIAGGVAQMVSVPATGPFLAAYPEVNANISFDAGAAPNGEVWMYRLETEKPHGWETLTGDVDNEYFIVRNFGINQTFAPLAEIQFRNIGYIDPNDAAQPELSNPLQIHKRSSNAFGATWNTALANSYATTSGTNGSVAYNNSANITSFSQFAIVNIAANSDLPVELMEFTATRKDNDQVLLNWSTASELNNKGFEIQRMLASESEFKTVGWVDGKGNSIDVINYQFTDENPFDGLSYYRLRQVDFDESSELTNTRVVDGLASSQFAHTEVYPNPVDKELRLRFTQVDSKKKATIQIFNAQGKRIYQQKITPNSSQVHLISEVANFATGIYLLSVDLNGEKFVQKFVKQ